MISLPILRQASQLYNIITTYQSFKLRLPILFILGGAPTALLFFFCIYFKCAMQCEINKWKIKTRNYIMRIVVLLTGLRHLYGEGSLFTYGRNEKDKK